MNYRYDKDFTLESGSVLPGFDLHYRTYGKLNEARDNVVWVCHALTGSAEVFDWWGGLFGEGKFYDPDKYFIVCANFLGGCYGSTGPLSKDPRSGNPFFQTFPSVTNRDIVASFDLLREHLNLHKVHTLIGGSMGGQHALEWAIQSPSVFSHLVLVATNAVHSPWGIAFNEAQRMAIQSDATWGLPDPEAGIQGMKAARAMALLSYRHYNTFAKTQAEKSRRVVDNFKASSYQVYQGEKLAKRFNAYTYWTLSKAMDSHNVGRGRKSIAAALQSVRARTLCIGVETDILFPVHEQQLIADHIPESLFKVIPSAYGHDGFLIETEAIASTIKSLYKESPLKAAQV